MNTIIIFFSFILLLLMTLSIIFYQKNTNNDDKKKLFKYMMICTFITTISELVGNIIYLDYQHKYIISLINSKIFMISVLTMFYEFTCYNHLIINKEDKFKSNNRSMIIRRVYYSIYLISLFLVVSTQVLFSNNEVLNYPYGLSSDILFLSIILFFNIWLISILLKNKTKQLLQLLLCIFIGLYCLIIREYYPQIIFISALETYVLLFIYFKDFNKEKVVNKNSEFLKDLSYKIKTPLSAIVEFSESIENSSSLEEAKENAQDVRDASNYLLNTVNNYIDIHEIDNKSIKLNEEEYNSFQLFENITYYAKDIINKDDVKLKTHISEDIPETLYGDYISIKKILHTLIKKSANYTNKGYIDLSIKCVKSHGLCRLIISIKDTGIGIKDEELQNLFNSRNDSSLYVVKQLVEIMGGKIVVESVLGKGSKFTVSIDQKICKNKEIDNIEIIETLDLKGKKILVVDDNKFYLKVLKKMIEKYNAKVDIVLNGIECIKLVSNNKYDLILLDETMPRMNGFETLVKLHQIEDFKIPTVVLISDVSSSKKHLDEGFNDYLLKPVSESKLHDILERYIKITVDPSLIVDEEDIIELNETSNKGDLEYLEKNNIDIRRGIELLGNQLMYNDMLAEFNEEIDSRIEKLKQYKDNDLKNYTIEVHSLKSDSKYLGFNELAEEAFKHEQAGLESNNEYIKENFDKLINLLEEVLNIIRKYL